MCDCASLKAISQGCNFCAFSRTPIAIRALIEKMWAFNPTDRASAAMVSTFLEACTVKPSLTGLGVKAP